MTSEIEDKLLDFVVDNFLVEKDEINLDKSLIDEGIIDSTGLIEIIAFLEEEFSIRIKDEQMTRDNFGSVVKIVDFVEKEINSQEILLSKAG